MRKNKVSTTLYVPIQNGCYLLDGRGAVRIYKTKENLQHYMQAHEYDQILTYELK